jgi:hypothetical protein
MATLEDTGTRYTHYQELLELFRNGKEVIKNKSVLITDDWKMYWKLDYAIELIERQLDILSRFDLKRLELRREVNAIPKMPKEETPKEENDKTDSIEENKEKRTKTVKRFQKNGDDT